MGASSPLPRWQLSVCPQFGALAAFPPSLKNLPYEVKGQNKQKKPLSSASGVDRPIPLQLHHSSQLPKHEKKSTWI